MHPNGMIGVLRGGINMQYIQTQIQDRIATVTISRPEALNALNRQMLMELRLAMQSIADDDTIRAVIITGEGRAFVAGADIAEMKDFTPEEALAYANVGHETFLLIERLPQPVIAAVNGFALGGGCELALACDIRIGSEKAKFGQPEVGLGITPGFGGTQRLVRTVGLGVAMQMICTGHTIDAQEALRIGLISTVYAPETLLPQAVAMAQQIAGNAPLAVRAAKQAIHRGLMLRLADGLACEAELFAGCFRTEDQKNAMRAFVDKKKPDGFNGK